VQELGHLALAVIQAGAYIFRSGCDIGLYLDLYQTRRGELLEEYRNYEQKMDNYEWTVYTTWQLSFERLKTHAAQAAVFLQHCAYLHHEGFSQALFQNAAVNITFPFDQEPTSLCNAKDLLGLFVTSGTWDTHKFLKLLGEIRSYSLIDLDCKAKTYSIHPLVHDWLRVTISNGEVARACAQCILAMSVSWEFGSEDYSFRRTLLPHIDAALQGGLHTGSDLTARLGLIYREGGRWKEAEELEVVVMETRKRVFGEEHLESLTSMACLASTYRFQGRWKEAEDLAVLVMETRKRVLGEEHPHSLTSMACLASTYRKKGRWKEAKELEVVVMETRKRVQGEEYPDSPTSINLASTHRNQGGRRPRRSRCWCW